MEIAPELYAAFLHCSSQWDGSLKPLTEAQTAYEDLSRAIDFIFEHADELQVDTDGYSLWGGSAGGRMADWVGTYGTDHLG